MSGQSDDERAEPARRRSRRGSFVLVGFLLALLASFLLLDDGPGIEISHLLIALGGALAGLVLAHLQEV